MPISFIKRIILNAIKKKPEPLAALPLSYSEPPRVQKGYPKSAKAGTRTVPKFQNTKANRFFGLGLSPSILEVIERIGFHTPTPIQEKTIPHALLGNDIMGIAQTGTGKTLAFGLPLLQRLASIPDMNSLILAPTRELAMQIESALRPFAKAEKIQSSVLIGGASMNNQIDSLKKGQRLIIATPGRLIDLMEQNEIKLYTTGILVLDEADRMLDMGFAPQLIKILKQVPRSRQTMLFSATMPPAITAIAASYMKLPIRIEVAPPGTAAETVRQELFVVAREQKLSLMEKLLSEHMGSVLVFTRTKRGAGRVALHLRKRGFAANEIHSDRSLSQRMAALSGFKSGKYRILVATDIAARGLDVTGIELVINFDLPNEAENYVHRIGRTGRAGRAGHAISIASPDQRREVTEIEGLINTSIAISTHPEIKTEQFMKSSRRSISDILYGPPKGKVTGRERPVTPLEKRPAHKKEWGR